MRVTFQTVARKSFAISEHSLNTSSLNASVFSTFFYRCRSVALEPVRYKRNSLNASSLNANLTVFVLILFTPAPKSTQSTMRSFVSFFHVSPVRLRNASNCKSTLPYRFHPIRALSTRHASKHSALVIVNRTQSFCV